VLQPDPAETDLVVVVARGVAACPDEAAHTPITTDTTTHAKNATRALETRILNTVPAKSSTAVTGARPGLEAACAEM